MIWNECLSQALISFGAKSHAQITWGTSKMSAWGWAPQDSEAGRSQQGPCWSGRGPARGAARGGACRGAPSPWGRGRPFSRYYRTSRLEDGAPVQCSPIASVACPGASPLPPFSLSHSLPFCPPTLPPRLFFFPFPPCSCSHRCLLGLLIPPLSLFKILKV